MALTQISTNGIKDATIATADIADDAVTADKIVDNAITAAALSNNCIAEANLQDDCITAAQIQAGVIAEVNLNIDNTPTNDYVLTAKSSAAGGLTWAAAASGVGGATGVDFNDDVKIRLGTGNDLEIYHTGSHGYITEGTGNLKISAASGLVQILKGSSEDLAKFTPDGNVELYYDNSKKLETTSSGITVTGTGYVSGGWRPLTDNAVSLGSSSYRWYDLNISNDINISDNGKVILGDGDDLQIYHDATNNIILSDAPDLYIKTTSSETCARFGRNGGIDLYYDNVKKLETTSSGATVIGELQIGDTSNYTKELRFADATRVDASSIKVDNSSNSDLLITNDRGSGAIRLATNSAERLRIDSSGRVGIGTTTTDKNDHSLLNVHRSTSDSNYMYFTNSTTGEAGSDGFTIGLDGDENALVWNRENTNMRFGTNATERMTILAAGGLTFNGDTAAANALSDYEEGTFTPILRTNGDTTGQVTGSGTYVKIGRAVHIHVLFGNKTLTSLPTGDIAVVSLPFTANHTNGDEFGMSSKMVVMGVDSNSTHGYFRTGNGSAAALGYFNQDGSTWAQWSTTQWDNSGVYLIFNMTYFTNS